MTLLGHYLWVNQLNCASDWLNQISHVARHLIRSTTQIWVVARHKYGIFALVSQTSFGGETSGSVAKCRLFSQASSTVTPSICSARGGRGYSLIWPIRGCASGQGMVFES